MDRRRTAVLVSSSANSKYLIFSKYLCIQGWGLIPCRACTSNEKLAVQATVTFHNSIHQEDPKVYSSRLHMYVSCVHLHCVVPIWWLHCRPSTTLRRIGESQYTTRYQPNKRVQYLLEVTSTMTVSEGIVFSDERRPSMVVCRIVASYTFCSSDVILAGRS